LVPEENLEYARVNFASENPDATALPIKNTGIPGNRLARCASRRTAQGTTSGVNSVALFDGVSEKRLLLHLFPHLSEFERGQLCKFRAVTLLLTRGVNADVSRMDAELRRAHEGIIKKYEIIWVGFRRWIEESNLMGKCNSFQRRFLEGSHWQVKFPVN
jgi:hypothetical protein